MRRLVAVTWLVVLWIALWRDLSVANLASGLVIAVVLSGALSLGWAGGRAGELQLRPIAVVRFIGYFAWKLVEANVVIAREVVTPRNRISTGIIAVPVAGCSEQVVTVVANAVSLTPGTVTLEISGTGKACCLYVHVLHLHDIERAREDVQILARLARRALQRELHPAGDAGETTR